MEHVADLGEAPHRMASVHIQVEELSSESKSVASKSQSGRMNPDHGCAYQAKLVEVESRNALVI